MTKVEDFPKRTIVRMPYNGRVLLGNVRETRPDVDDVRLTVRHFNGERWPVEPLASTVEIVR